MGAFGCGRPEEWEFGTSGPAEREVRAVFTLQQHVDALTNLLIDNERRAIPLYFVPPRPPLPRPELPVELL